MALQGFFDALRTARKAGFALLESFGPPRNADRLDNLDQNIAPFVIPIYGLFARYFRAEIVGLEHMPEGKALVVGNHNSGITFLEPILLGRAWHRKNGGPDDFAFLVHDAMVALPFLGNILMKCGAVRASRNAAARVFAADRKMVTFPGGNREAFRPWTRRHTVDFHGRKGFAKLAIREGAPIVPLLCDGGHNTFFVLWQGTWLAEKLGVKRYLRSESFPVFLGLPWGVGVGPVFHLPLPAKMFIELGPAIPTDHIPPDKADDPETVQALYDEVEGRVRAMMARRHETRTTAEEAIPPRRGGLRAAG